MLYQCHNSLAAKTSLGNQFSSETAEATKCCPEGNVVDRSRYVKIGSLASKTTDITRHFRIIPAVYHDLCFEVAADVTTNPNADASSLSASKAAASAVLASVSELN